MAEISATTVCVRAQRALSKSPIYALRELRVEHVENNLLICGRVLSFYHKQLAQEAVRAVAGGLQVVNSIEVPDQAPV